MCEDVDVAQSLCRDVFVHNTAFCTAVVSVRCHLSILAGFVTIPWTV